MLLLVTLTAVSWAGGARAVPPAGDAKALGDEVEFPACGLSLRQPEGFSKASQFEGFGDPETQSSVVVVCLQGPYAAITAGFTKEQMSARGWTLRRREEIQVEGQPALLVDFEQPAGGQVFSKLILAFGDDSKTTLVTASFPKAHEEQLAGRLKATLLSARVGTAAAPPGLGTDLPFSVDPSAKLKRSPGMNKALIYTEDGALPLRMPGDPLFIVAPSVSDVEMGDRRQFAEKRLRATAQATGLTVTSTEPIKVAGLDGYESLAEAEDAKSKTPIVVYQVMLFDGGSYILMQGLVGTARRDELLPEFQAMSRSFRMRDAGVGTNRK